ncbi:MAG: cation:dicarboxylase symporter family transporter [Verrucomicrobia bacterium]|nr:cation:dicarboxylase symporter family transporter [Verrucomicrobiota bacterium]
MVISLLKQRGIQVILLLTFYLLVASSLPLAVHQGFYTVSLFIKDLLVWMLPITVSFFIAHTVCTFERKAPLFILAIVIFEAISNFSSVWYAYGGGHVAASFLPSIDLPATNYDFSPLWRLPFSKPSWWSADKGSFLGLVLGFAAAFSKKGILKTFIYQGKERAQWALTRIFSRLIPLFVLGFVARMHQTKLLQHVMAHYGVLLLWLVVLIALYIAILFVLGSGRRALQAMKNLFPAGAISFTSGCSLSTMPWTMEGASKNLNNPQLARAVIPATTNIQQIGDCITNTFLCFLIFRQFFGYSPDIMTWMQFSVVFVLARFATAAVMGGAIFIMLPIYEAYLSFNPEMIAIILAFNVVLDPLVTSSNVVANGALCRIFEKVWMRLPGTRTLEAKEPSRG